MKVLLIDVNCKKSSTGKIVYDLYTECRKVGYEAAICYGRGSKLAEENIFKFGLDVETNFHALMTRITGLTGRFSYFSTQRLLKFMDEFKPDVVHLHELHAYFVNLAPVINYLKKNNIKTVWTFHCEFMYTGKCGYAFECEEWHYECGKCPRVKEYPSSLFWDFTKQMFSEKKRLFDGFDNLTIVTPSKWLAKKVKQSFLGDRDIRVIHNGIDTINVFQPRPFDHLKEKHNIADEKIVLAVAPGLMDPRKGGRTVLELAKWMKAGNLKFILIGVDDLKEKFDNNVIALGSIEDQQKLAEYYSMADVFVLCSEKETFSLTSAEALCCGTPVVGFKSGAPETVFEQPYANFVEQGDLDALEQAVIRALNNPMSPSDLRLYGQDTFSIGKMSEQYFETYK